MERVKFDPKELEPVGYYQGFNPKAPPTPVYDFPISRKENFDLIGHLPVFLCNLPVGHGGTYAQPHGGAFAEITLKWLDWQMKGQDAKKSFFCDPAYQQKNYPEWTVERKMK